MKYTIVDLIGTTLQEADTHEEAESIIDQYEKEDKKDGEFVENAYTIIKN